MSTTLASDFNGRTRKTLAHQLDRLDGILDGLADALNESVADAVKSVVEAVVREAVAAAVAEVLSRPELRRTVSSTSDTATTASAQPSLLRRAWKRVAGAAAAFGQRCTMAIRQMRRTLAQRAARITAAIVAGFAVARACRAAAPVATVTGALVGAACYLAGPAVAAIISGLTTGIMALVAATISRLRHPPALAAQSGLQ